MSESGNARLLQLQIILRELECGFLYIFGDIGLIDRTEFAQAREAVALLHFADSCRGAIAHAVSATEVADLLKILPMHIPKKLMQRESA
jgi:hypothetical protein